MRRAARTAIASLCLFAWSPGVMAQIHADVDIEAGGSQRLLSSRPASAPGEPGVGPTVAVSGHVAILPLLRAGPYVTFDLSPLGGEPARQILSAGLGGRLYAPWPRGLWRAWLGLGFGYGAARAPAFADFASSSGGFFEVPIGVGASLRLSRSFGLVAEAGTRIAFDFTGTMYNRGDAESAPTRTVPPAGNDSLGVFLALGLAFEL